MPDTQGGHCIIMQGAQPYVKGKLEQPDLVGSRIEPRAGQGGSRPTPREGGAWLKPASQFSSVMGHWAMQASDP